MAEYAFALLPLLGLVALTWVASVPLKDVSIIDPMWSLLFVAAGATWWWAGGRPADPRTLLVAGLVSLWGLRLAIHLGIRKWGEPEDHRYVAMREANGPNFWLRSLVTIFCLQAVLAWLIAAPIFASVGTEAPLGALDYAGAAVWMLGFVFQVGGDSQLARFKADEGNRGKVLDSGLWRYTRHPNYFGEFCIWWGVWLVACAGGGAWSVFGPILISFLLLKVSGVTMLEKDIGERRPGYREYIQRTNAFFPGPPRRAQA